MYQIKIIELTMLWGSLDGRGICGGNGYMAEFLCCLLETITTLLIGYSPTLGVQLVKNPPAMQESWVQSLGGGIPWRRGSIPTPVFWTGEFHWLYSPLGLKESDMAERFSLHFTSLKNKMFKKVTELLNCGVGEDSWESLELQGDSTSPS